MNRLVLWFIVVMSVTAASLLAQETEQSIPGSIAYIGTDFNVYRLTLDDREPVQLTSDAGLADNRLRYYQWPTWSREGELAFFGNLLTPDGRVTTEVYIASADEEVALIYTGENEVFNYAAWSPASRDLAVLLSSAAANSLIVQVMRGAENFTVGSGQPFYYSFSTDGTRLLMQRNNARLDVYNLPEMTIEATLEQRPGVMYAPAWSPVDDRLLFGARGVDERTTDLVIVSGNDQVLTLVGGLAGPVYFAWSPDGTRVAYSDRRGAVVVMNAISGETIARGASTGVFSFFWSPDSERIAYITAAAPPGSFSVSDAAEGRLSAQAQQPMLSWTVLDVATGDSRRYSGFVPTRDLVYLFTYYDQFAQSHSLWSPDSRYLVYSEMVEDRGPVIKTLDVQQQFSEGLIIADGFVGVWSYR